MAGKSGRGTVGKGEVKNILMGLACQSLWSGKPCPNHWEPDLRESWKYPAPSTVRDEERRVDPEAPGSMASSTWGQV